MSHTKSRIFDPRVKFQHWPEPNDDPNIPYAWGEGGLGYAINGYRPNETACCLGDSHISDPPKVVVTPLKTKSSRTSSENVATWVVATSSVLGIIGLYEGFTDSTSSGGERIFDSLQKGVIYATGVGFLFNKLK